MPYGIPAQARLCPNCDGFPIVAITTGTRRRDGTRTLLHVTCRVCRGTGSRPARRREASRV
ncbi:hypothetical protein SMD44_03003 [Streptomyces alboflavus]|uniref:Uncharacterized protein n=1 Tax=Streptomyces alboflavus TaxID=67267 RepID=A0A1Z1WAU6_9ACTN|nr:hypothetical protein [Streptomyces alboflavus]ARX83581.1 hypothetical protein SMD44_03003 [Streptomyces alboflavus]